MASAYNYQSDQAPDAFKEEEARRERALRRAMDPTAVVEFPDEPVEDDLEDQLEESHAPVEDDATKMENMNPAPQRVDPPPPRPVKRHSVTLSCDLLTVQLEVDEVSIDIENQSIGLLIPSGTDIMPKVQGEFKLTARGTTYDVIYAGARMKIESLGSLLVSFVARKLENDQDGQS